MRVTPWESPGPERMFCHIVVVTWSLREANDELLAPEDDELEPEVPEPEVFEPVDALLEPDD